MIIQGIEERVFFSLTDTTGKLVKDGGFLDIYELKEFLADLPIREQIRMFESIVAWARRAIEAGRKIQTVNGMNDPACHEEWNQSIAPFGGGFWADRGYGYYKTVEHFEKVIRQEIEALKQKAPVRPEYIQKMIDVGLLYPDGMRVQKRLADIIYFLEAHGMEPSIQFIHEGFRKRDGFPYAERTIEKDLEAAHAK